MKNSKSVVELRQKRILEYLQTHGQADVAALAQAFNVTPTTIRRDLELFEEKQYVQRYFGGVRYALPPNTDVQYQTPQGNPSPRKLAIARAAAALVQDGDMLFLNSSSTALYILNYLTATNVTVITNNGRALYAKRDAGVNLMLTGGEVYGQKQSLVGEFAAHALSMITATKCFLGVSGISVAGGITSTIIQETSINQKMLARCNGPHIVVADGSKIGVKHNFFSGHLSEITHLVTDSSADREELARIREMGIEVILAEV